MDNLQKTAKTFVEREFSLINQAAPKLKDAKYGKVRKNIKQFEKDLRAYTNEIKSNEELYKLGCETFGENDFVAAVENGRYEIGKKMFGYDS